MTQTAGAFQRVADALTFFVTYYTSLADFKSVVDRLDLLRFGDRARQGARRLPARRGSRPRPSAAPVALEDLGITLPDGRRIIEAQQLTFQAGQSVLLAGPSGSGKSTFFRTISGIWPFGEGRVRIPDGADVMVVPQKPYIPIGTLRAASPIRRRPAPMRTTTSSRHWRTAQLGFLAAELDRDEIWSQRLSGGEQQRLAIARALLKRPDWLFMDESTSALDEKLEAELYRVLTMRLPKTTIVSIGHRSTLRAFHSRRLDMTEGAAGHFTPRDPAEAAE